MGTAFEFVSYGHWRYRFGKQGATRPFDTTFIVLKNSHSIVLTSSSRERNDGSYDFDQIIPLRRSLKKTRGVTRQLKKTAINIIERIVSEG